MDCLCKALKTMGCHSSPFTRNAKQMKGLESTAFNRSLKQSKKTLLPLKKNADER